MAQKRWAEWLGVKNKEQQDPVCLASCAQGSGAWGTSKQTQKVGLCHCRDGQLSGGPLAQLLKGARVSDCSWLWCLQ